MIFGSKLYRAPVVQNTMQWAREYLSQAPDGAVFLADTVQQAQGRQGRVWSIAPGQLLFTAVLKPAMLAQCDQDDLGIRLNQLSMALSLGILEPIKQYGIGIKWPNDFVAGDKKVCGMLMQAVWESNKLQGLILGFGLNINNKFESEDELHSSAMSLRTLTGTELNMRELYKQLLSSLDQYYLMWQNEQYIDIYRAWKQEQVLLHKHVSVHEKDGSLISGILSQVLPNGDAMLTTASKQLKVVQFCNVESITQNVASKN
ncbi:biotin--[acetyl-CoA-carboxylase] ligase [Candidatus Dependentiae bacterium]|nr:biotin--[acetyl-CoA-carboxylase] ligase [Candidatus Dependentiae bacterium]